MLGKLLKYEFRSSVRTFLPLYAAVIIFASICGLFISDLSWWSNNSPVFMVAFFAYGGVLMAAFVVTIIMVVNRFSKSLLGDEGYLMFTLPVKLHQHIISKVLSAVIWIFFTWIVVLISLIITGTGFFSAFDVLGEFISEILHYLSIDPLLFLRVLFEFILASTVASVSGILLIYTSICISHLFNKFKSVFGFISFILITSVANVINSNIISGDSILSYPYNLPYVDFYGEFSMTLWIAIAVDIVWSIIYFVIITYILTNRLNLE